MEQIASQIVGPVVNILTGFITKHIGYLTSSGKYVTDMTNRLNVLAGISSDVKTHMENNKESDKEIPARVPTWLLEVENVKKDVESISSNDIGCLHMKKRYRAGRNALKAMEKIERLISEEKEIKWSDAKKPLGRVYSKQASTSALSPSVAITQNDFKSRSKAFKDTLKFLQQDDKAYQVIALCGMGGVGKTTMMEQLKEVSQDNKMFDWIVKVAIGQNPNMLSVQNDIAAYIEVKLPEGTKMVKADHLCKRFKNLSQAKKMILVILDDVWDKIELKDIGLTSPLPNGVKLLLTSRNSNICTQIAACVNSNLQVVRVDVLEEKEAQFFFSQIAGVSQEHDHDLYNIGCDIVRKCGYLPLAIKLIASALKSQEIYAWRDTLKDLKNEVFDDSVQDIIRISYNYMKKDEKQIFLHCGLFPEDSDIPIEDLMRHAWGLKLFKNVSSLKEARDKTNTCVHNLINANLLMNGDDLGYVKMHDLVLAFVLDEVSKGDHAWIINHGDVFKWEINERAESCKRLSLTCKDMSEFPTNLKYPNLSLLQLRRGDLFPEDFYKNMEKLEVIACYNMVYPLLPRSIHCSKNLRTLCLHKCELMVDFSFVGDLVNLEVLSFAHCRIRKLPSVVGNLRKLKLLDLTGCDDLHIDDGVFINLKNLEELYMTASIGSAITQANFEELEMISSNLCALEVEFVTEMALVKNMCFNKLDKFKISMGCVLAEGRYALKSTLNTLKLVIDSISELGDSKINELFEKTEKLHLQVKDMISLKNVCYDQHSFSSLRDLEVSKCANLKYLFPISVASGLRKLERLKISSCSVLEALVDNVGSEISSVFELPKLVELEVAGLPNFTSIYSDKNSSSALLNSQVRIPELKKLTIKSMENLKHIWSGEIGSEEEVNNISMLREINVKECESLENLFPTNPMPLFNNLEQLYVRNCGSIKEIFNIDLKCVVRKDEQLSSSRLRSISVYGSENLTEVWKIKGGEDNSSLLISGFKAVESIQIFMCERFKNVFRPTNTKFDMGALTEIMIHSWSNKPSPKKEKDDNISSVPFPSNLMHSFSNLHKLQLRYCNDVEVVFEIDSRTDLVTPPPLLPNLQDLALHGMKRMNHVWKWSNFSILQNQSSFHNLTAIQLLSCNRIKYLFSPLMAKLLSNLKIIKIDECDGMEELVSNRDDKDEDIYEDEEMTTSTNFFPHLQSLSFERLKKLERIGGGGDMGTTDVIQSSLVRVVSWSLWQNSREIHIDKCESLMVVFETQGINNESGGDTTSTSIHERNGGTNISRLEKWNVPQKFNLMKLVITSCNLLKHVFMFSILESLTQLEELTIKDCGAMEIIVKDENVEQRTVVEFSSLKSLNLANLPNLKGFFLGINEFKWPLLENVTISECPQMKLFTYSVSTTSKLKHIHTSLGKHSLECGLNFRVSKLHETTLPSSERSSLRSATLERLPWSFHNLIEIDMEDEHEVECIIPSNELRQLRKLERIRVKTCYRVEEVFEVEAMEGTNSESPTVVQIPNLTQLELEHLRDFKYIWNSNHHQRTTLEFPNLTTLVFTYCDDLEHVFTSSMIGSLLQLKDLRISSCRNLKVIVKEKESESESKVFEEVAMKGTKSESQSDAEIPNLRQVKLKFLWNLTTLSISSCDKLEHVFTSSMIVKEEEEEVSECDAEVKQIMLPCLKSMNLTRLPNLKGFCLGKNDFSLPSLRALKIKKCPQIVAFTNGHLDTPVLEVIDTSFARCYVRGDLNSLIQTKKQEGFQF